MDTLGAFGWLIIMILLLIVAVFAFFMPIFVFQIKNTVRSINKELSVISDLLQKKDI